MKVTPTPTPEWWLVQPEHRRPINLVLIKNAEGENPKTQAKSWRRRKRKKEEDEQQKRHWKAAEVGRLAIGCRSVRWSGWFPGTNRGSSQSKWSCSRKTSCSCQRSFFLAGILLTALILFWAVISGWRLRKRSRTFQQCCHDENQNQHVGPRRWIGVLHLLVSSRCFSLIFFPLSKVATFPRTPRCGAFLREELSAIWLFIAVYSSVLSLFCTPR